MATIKSMDIENENEIEVRLLINKKEYDLLERSTSNLILVPEESLKKRLTTGKLGNSNRVMLPKKLVRMFDIEDLDKKVPASLFSLNDKLFLLAMIKDNKKGVPKFE